MTCWWSGQLIRGTIGAHVPLYEVFHRVIIMLTPAEGAWGGDIIQLYAFVLEKTRQHFIYYNFHEREMSPNFSDDTNQIKKIFMHGPVPQGKLPNNGNWFHYNHCVIQQNDQSCVDVFVHTLKILDSLFHEVLYAENYVLKISLCAREKHDLDKLQYLLGALSVNHILATSESCSNATTFEFISWNSEGGQDVFCNGEWEYKTGLTITIAMLKLVLLVAKKSEKFPLPQAPVLHVIVPLTEQQKMIALTLAHVLHKHACATDVYLQQACLEEHLQKAHLSGARYVFVIGADEQAHGTVLINDLNKQTSTVVAQDGILTFLGVYRAVT